LLSATRLEYRSNQWNSVLTAEADHDDG
jgi:hypothetical protein